MISIFTLNLWRYYDFDSRLPNIVKAIKETQPDVVCLQEVQINPAISPLSQVEIIKKQLSEYKYSIHSTTYQKDSQQGKKLDTSVQHGMAVLSKYPILNAFEFFVTLNEGEAEPRSMLCFDAEIHSMVFKFANVHFANREEWAKNQLQEFLDLICSRGEKRIIAGDFNMFKLPQYGMLQGYKLSYDYKAYDSYPKDGGCLDYVAIPDEFEFSKVELLEDYLSDHKGLLVAIR
ncbi:MAG: endonuclease/exonuclease/phosphatase family protein [bacterium]|nr:endonuclease/exonuclease/phosphatase family protein [bacterium]